MPKNNTQLVAKKNAEMAEVKAQTSKLKRVLSNPKFWLSAGMIASALAAAILLKRHLLLLSKISTLTAQNEDRRRAIKVYQNALLDLSKRR